MAETLTLTSSEGSEIVPIDLETFRSRLEELSETRVDLFVSSETSPFDSKKLVEDCISDFHGRMKQIESEESNVASLGLEDLDAYLEQLKKEISSTEEETMKISGEIGDLTRTLAVDSNRLDGDLESLAFLLKLIDSQGLHHFQAGRLNGTSLSGDIHDSPMDVSKDHKFEILKLHQQIEKSRINLSTLQDLDYVFKRVEAIGQIEDKLSEVKVLEFEGNCIRLSLKTPIPSSDGMLLRHKLNCLVESSVLDHELLIEVVDNTLQLRNVEIFPDDVYLDDIIHRVKCSSLLPITMSGSTLGCLIRQVQYRILLCTLRRLLVKDANKSRHSFEYSDRDETITAHLIGGIDTFLKIPQGWPILKSALKLVSIKNSDIHSKSISLSFLCKIKELANSLNSQTRGHLTRFVDAIEEILVREMHSKIHSNGIPA